jgi:hypothetical protein
VGTGQERYGDDLGPANLENHYDQIVTEWSKRDSTRQKEVGFTVLIGCGRETRPNIRGLERLYPSL